MVRMKKYRFFLISFFFLIAPITFGANVFVTEMDLTSNINLRGEIDTRGDFEISYDGGYKYQGKLLFQYLNTDLENNTLPALSFYGAQASVKNIFQVLDLTYWTGYYGILGEGKHYKGHLYHRGGFEYNGYLPVQGTGLVFSGNYYDRYGGQFFIYQRYGSSTVNSLDLNFSLNADPLLLKLFTGTTENVWRAGMQFIYLGDLTELYFTVGEPTIEMGNTITFDDFYFLLEEWFKMKNWNLILSIFSRPEVHYNYLERDYVVTGEKNDIDFNFDLNYEPETSYFSSGTELNIQTNSSESFGVYISPYISIFTSGVIWKVKVDFNLISEDRDLITAYLNVKASF